MGEAVYTLTEAVRCERAASIELKMAAALAKWPSDVEPDDTPASVILTLAEAKAIRVALSDAENWHASQRFAAQVAALAARTEASANSPEIPDSSIPAIQAGDVEAIARLEKYADEIKRLGPDRAFINYPGFAHDIANDLRTILALRPVSPAGDVGKALNLALTVMKEDRQVVINSWANGATGRREDVDEPSALAELATYDAAINACEAALSAVPPAETPDPQQGPGPMAGLVEAARDLLDETEDMHGEGAFDASCPACQAHARLRQALPTLTAEGGE